MTRYAFIALAFTLLLGFLFGASFIKWSSRPNKEDVLRKKTLSVLVHDGNTTRSWNGVSIFEGDSVANVVDHIAQVENIALTWGGTGRDRQIISFEGKDAGSMVWHVYINNTPLPTTIGRFYPMPGDAITLIYSAK